MATVFEGDLQVSSDTDFRKANHKQWASEEARKQRNNPKGTEPRYQKGKGREGRKEKDGGGRMEKETGGKKKRRSRRRRERREGNEDAARSKHRT